MSLQRTLEHAVQHVDLRAEASRFRAEACRSLRNRFPPPPTCCTASCDVRACDVCRVLETLSTGLTPDSNLFAPKRNGARSRRTGHRSFQSTTTCPGLLAQEDH